VPKINYSPRSLRDLLEIGDYIAEELHNPSAALQTVQRIQETIDKLSMYPQMGARLSTKYEDVGDYRFVVSGHYLAFYRVVADTVYIDRVLYGKRDYVNILFGCTLEDDDGEEM